LFENVDVFYILEFYIFFVFWKYVSHDASGRTGTKRERKLFLVFLENKCYTVRATGQTQ